MVQCYNHIHRMATEQFSICLEPQTPSPETIYAMHSTRPIRYCDSLFVSLSLSLTLCVIFFEQFFLVFFLFFVQFGNAQLQTRHGILIMNRPPNADRTKIQFNKFPPM